MLFGLMLAAAAFGVELGVPMALPPCRHAVIGGMESSVYEEHPSVTCAEPAIQLNGVDWQRGSVNFPDGAWPSLSSFSGIYYYVIDGKTEGLEVQTPGHATHEGHIVIITEKYGKPSEIRREPVPVGAVTLSGVVAIWTKPDVIVEYHSIDPRTSGGRGGKLTIETPKMQAARAQHLEQILKARTPL